MRQHSRHVDELHRERRRQRYGHRRLRVARRLHRRPAPGDAREQRLGGAGQRGPRHHRRLDSDRLGDAEPARECRRPHRPHRRRTMTGRHRGLVVRIALPLVVAAITIITLRPSTGTGHATSLSVSSAKLLLLTAGPPADVVPPQLVTLAMFDADANGKVDRVVATFDEALATPY